MIRALGLAELAARCGVAKPAQDVHFTAVSTDSRQLKKGDLFVALRGDHFDGHDFLSQVDARGACAAVVEKPRQDVVLPQLVVDNTVRALGHLGALNRDQFTGPVVGITGSSGKTTVKEMVAAILKVRGDVLVTRGNLNNHIGVPLMLLQIDSSHRHAVIEMGASAVGEIAYLAALVRPHVSVITNVGTAHVGGFGSVDNIARGKAEIYDALGRDGTAIINQDDHYSAQWLQQNKQRKKILFSVRQPADVMAKQIRGNAVGLFSFDLVHGDESVDIHLAVMGEHNVANALAAASCCLALGVDLTTIRQGLETVTAVAGRMQYKAGLAGLALIDDTYNANPAAVRAAIDALKNMKGTRVLALGDMAELGELSEQLHADTGRYAREQGIDVLMTVGTASRACGMAFGEGAMHFNSKSELVEACRQMAKPGVIVLVKGSRSSGMEEVINGLLNVEKATC